MRAGLRPPPKLHVHVSCMQLSRRLSDAGMREKGLNRSTAQARTRRKAWSQAAVSSPHCANAVRSNKSMLTHSRFKQPDATRPSASGRSPDDFPENAPCQPGLAFSARGACGLRDSTSRKRREVASDVAGSARSRGQATHGGSCQPSAQPLHSAMGFQSRCAQG